MKSILKKTIVITLLLVLALSLGLIAVGCNDTPPATEDTFYKEEEFFISTFYMGDNMPRYSLVGTDLDEGLFEGIIDKEVFYKLINFDKQATSSLFPSLGYVSFKQDNTSCYMLDVEKIEDGEIKYFGNRTELSSGEIVVHKWRYYNILLSSYGIGLDQTVMSQILESENTLPKFIATFTAHSTLVRYMYPLVLDKYDLDKMYQYNDGSMDDDAPTQEITVSVKKEGESRELKIVGYYTTGEEDCFLNTVFDSGDFLCFDYYSTATESAVIEEYFTQPDDMTDKEEELLSKYREIIKKVYCA